VKAVWEKLRWAVWKILRWFDLSWWQYLLDTRVSTRFPPKYGWLGWGRLWCRIQGHRSGVIWFNPGGFEPDMHCKNCGDDLG